MANKNKQANNAILMAILQDINAALTGNNYGNAASTAVITMANVERDGADKGDYIENSTNNILDQNGDILDKITIQFNQHPEILNELDKFADDNGLMQEESDNYLQDLGNLIELYLSKVQKHGEGGQFEEQLDVVTVKIGDKKYKLLYLYSEEQKETGLKNVEDMEDDEGALFDYSDDPKASISFWMKDTTIPLTVLFINKDGVVISSHKGVPLSEDYITEESEPVYWVIELNKSQDISTGTYTDLSLYEDPDEAEDLEDEHPELDVNKLYIYGSNGEVQGTLQGGERIFSRKSTKVIIRKAKRAYVSKLDKDYKALGRYVFNEMDAQDSRKPEYV